MKLETTARTRLEPLVADHASELFPVLSDPAIYAYLPEKPPVSLAALAERYRRLESRTSADGTEQWLNWAVRRIEDGQCVGYVQATVHAERTADVGFTLAPSYWGLGLAHESCQAMLAALFRDYQVAAVFATVDRHNLRSAALLQRLGFRRILTAEYPHGTVEDLDDAYRLARPV